jgi:hypothetical protein
MAALVVAFVPVFVGACASNTTDATRSRPNTVPDGGIEGGSVGDANTPKDGSAKDGSSCSDGAPPCFLLRDKGGSTPAGTQFECCANGYACAAPNVPDIDPGLELSYTSCTKECTTGADCDSGVCGVQADTSFVQRRLCQVPNCHDGVKNGSESDVDCGNVCEENDPAHGAILCLVGKSCLGPDDCVTGVCSADGRCAALGCADGAKNGDETGVDCGGSCPKKCADGAACNTVNDCQSGNCDVGLCYPITCRDGVVNGDETDVDCGGACPAKCAIAKRCAVDGDCIAGDVCRGSDGGERCTSAS